MYPVLPAETVSMDELLARVAEHDCRAFELVYRAGFPLVFRSVLAVLRDHALSEEVTQDVFLEIWCTADRFERHRGNAEGWMLTIARHRAIDRVRTTQAARRRDHAAALEELGATAPDPADEAERALQRSALSVALDTMDDRARELLLLYGRGTPYRDLASMMDVPLGTAKSRVRLALAELRRTWNANSPA